MRYGRISRLLAGVFLGVLCAPSLAKPPVPASAYHEQGRQIYNFRCYYCHGYSGNAKTVATTFLTPKPRDFTNTPLTTLSRKRMIDSVRKGRPGTAMQAFGNVLNDTQAATVVDFIRREFMTDKAENTRYHIAANGWPEFSKYSSAAPFATGTISLATPQDQLTPAQQAGKRLFLSTCISCHDRGDVSAEALLWDPRPVSYPRSGYSHQDPPSSDAVSSASIYGQHDIKPKLTGLSAQQRRGETLFQNNCAFCHGADGTGKNWIGSFLEPHPRNLADPKAMQGMSRKRLHKTIREGLPGSSMPAWGGVLKPAEIDAIVAYVARAFYPMPPD